MRRLWPLCPLCWCRGACLRCRWAREYWPCTFSRQYFRGYICTRYVPFQRFPASYIQIQHHWGWGPQNCPGEGGLRWTDRTVPWTLSVPWWTTLHLAPAPQNQTNRTSRVSQACLSLLFIKILAVYPFRRQLGLSAPSPPLQPVNGNYYYYRFDPAPSSPLTSPTPLTFHIPVPSTSASTKHTTKPIRSGSGSRSEIGSGTFPTRGNSPRQRSLYNLPLAPSPHRIWAPAVLSCVDSTTSELQLLCTIATLEEGPAYESGCCILNHHRPAVDPF